MKNENELFERLRQVPTELSKQEVEKMMKGFPGMPPQPFEQSSWTNLLSFKNISMTVIPIIIAISVLTFSPFSNDSKVVSGNNNTIEIQKEIVTNGEEPNEFRNRSFVKESENEMPEEFSEIITPGIVIGTEDNKPQVRQPKTKNLIADSSNKKAKSTSPQLASKKESEKDKRPSDSKYDFRIPILDLKPDFEKSPILSNFRMRGIKRKLYKNLVNDGIIASKSVSVVMELPGEKIIVNGVEIPEQLFQKYKDLTYRVKSGPNRKIKMNKHYIKIGDFNLDGFYGAGFGTFKNSLLENSFPKMEPSNLLSKEPFEEEYKDLVDFANSVRKPIESKPSLYGVNLNSKNCKLLHSELQGQLITDQLITTNNGFVVIQHQKDKLIINGEILAGEQKSAYSKIISRFKIKTGKKREILMSEHIICVGDFTGDDFTGTINIVN